MFERPIQFRQHLALDSVLVIKSVKENSMTSNLAVTS